LQKKSARREPYLSNFLAQVSSLAKILCDFAKNHVGDARNILDFTLVASILPTALQALRGKQG